ncbi:MAG: hypothetical protein LC136_09260 [Burkholderiales bacterium]|nr:hypothetical protein [Burkholderiales bacterium]
MKFAAMLRAEGVHLGLHVLPAYIREGATALYQYRRLDGNGDPVPAISEPGYQLTDEGIAVYCGILAGWAKELACDWSYLDAMEDVKTEAEWADDPIAGQEREVLMANIWLSALADVGATSLYLEGSSPRDLEYPARAGSPVMGGATDYDLESYTFPAELARNIEKFGTPGEGGYPDVPGTIGWIAAWRETPPANPVTLPDFQSALAACIEHQWPMAVYAWPAGAPADLDAWLSAMREMEESRLAGLPANVSPVMALSQAIADALVSGAFSRPFEISRTLTPKRKLTDSEIVAMVVPRGLELADLTRAAVSVVASVDVGLMGRPTSALTVDDLAGLAQEIIDYLTRRDFESLGATWTSTAVEPLYDFDSLNEDGNFVSVLRFTYTMTREIHHGV